MSDEDLNEKNLDGNSISNVISLDQVIEIP
jgi:hypothetical protein